MNFKLYDILSSLIPGFLLLLTLLEYFNFIFDNDMVVAYTAISFLLGFLINAMSSWLEDLFFLTWRGKPSDRLIAGKDIWKVRFYESKKARDLLLNESGNINPSDDELFSIAQRYANKNGGKVEDLNASYAFARSLLTCVLIGGILFLCNNYDDWKSYSVIIPIIIIVWLRCKQRAYHYAREVLNVYLHQKINP